MPESLGTTNDGATDLSPAQPASPQHGSLLSTRESVGTEAWPWSTPSGVVWSNPPSVRRRSTPAWQSAAFTRLQALRTLRRDWNTYGSGPIGKETIDAVFAFMSRSLSPHTPPPAIVPTPGGGIQLEWHQNGIDLEIEWLPDRVECSAVDQRGDEEFVLRTQFDLIRLRKILGRLT